MKIKEHQEWIDKKGTSLKLQSIEGKWHKILKSKREDRLFFLKINDSDEFIITHDQQISIMKHILLNDIIPNTFKTNCKKFENALEEIKTKWNKEFNESN